MYLKVNETYSNFDDSLARSEKNDCMVRSVASACNVSYRTAHTFCKEYLNREDKRGTNGMYIIAQMIKWETTGIEIGGKKLAIRILPKNETKNLYKVKGENIWRQKTLKSFIESHKQGTYMVMVANHALTIKDGEVLDWGSNAFKPTRKVQSVYEVIDNRVGSQLELF